LGDFLGDTEREDVFCLSGAAVLGLRVAKFAGYRFEEVTAPNANQQSGPEQDYGLKASEVAAGPMDTLLDVPPEREFVQSKSGADTVEQGYQATDQKRRRLGSLGMRWGHVVASNEARGLW
jgi:hypothetical protein